MAERLTKAQRDILVALVGCTEPWWPANPYNKRMLTNVEKLGFASRRYGYPVGWLITETGRQALRTSDGGKDG